MNGGARHWRPPPLIRDARRRWALWLLLALYLVAAFATLGINPARIAQGWTRGERFVAGFFPPDFHAD